MIGAREQTSAAAALGHLGAAMPAHIEECAQPAVATAHDQDGHAGIIIGAEAAGRRPLRGESHHDRVLAEQDPLLGGETLRIGVDRHIVAPGRVGHGGGLGVDEMQQPLQKVNLVMPAHRTNSGFLSRLKWEIEITRYATVSCAAVLFNTAPYRSIAPETTGRDKRPARPVSGVQSALRGIGYGANHFCSGSSKNRAQAATRLARRRGVSSKNRRLWPNRNV